VEMPVLGPATKLFAHPWAHLLHHGQALLGFKVEQAQQQINPHARAVQSLSAIHHQPFALLQTAHGEHHEAGEEIAVFSGGVSSAYGIDWEHAKVHQRFS
jgi:hypothetical protein